MIHVATTSSESWAQHTAVMINSLSANCTTRPVAIHVLTADISPHSEEQLRRSVVGDNVDLRVVPVEAARFDTWPTTHHFKQANYYRLLLPELLDLGVQRLVYLDSDLVVRGDVDELWRTDLNERIIGAVEASAFNRHAALGMPEGARYFCSGVMLVDVVAWGAAGLTQKAEAYVQEFPDAIQMVDQDVLNGILRGDWVALHPKWDLQTAMLRNSYESTGYEREDYLLALENPAIVHFTGNSKPWHYRNEHPWKNEYFRYLARTPYADFEFGDRSYRQVIARHMRNILRGTLGRGHRDGRG